MGRLRRGRRCGWGLGRRFLRALLSERTLGFLADRLEFLTGLRQLPGGGELLVVFEMLPDAFEHAFGNLRVTGRTG